VGGLRDEEQNQVRLDESGRYIPFFPFDESGSYIPFFAALPRTNCARCRTIQHSTRVSSVGVYFD
jgi:hypothetical protein